MDTLEALTESLKEFNPIVLCGSVKGKNLKTNEGKRDELIRKFQEDKNSRLIISIIRVITESISLHDTKGDEPRYTFLSPSYELLLMHQACGRTLRDGKNTKSNVTVRFVYIKKGELEMEINNALSRKSQNLKDALIRGENILCPSDFEIFIEEKE